MAYQVMPDLTTEEYEALKADIQERGVQVPVLYDEHGNILDGYHRVRACEELGLTDWPRETRSGLSEDEKALLAYALNLHRRHLTKEQRVQVEADLRQRGWSYRRIGEALNVEPSTVMRDVRGVANATPDHVQGADGKTYAAERPEPPPCREAEAPAPAPEPSPAKVEADFGEAPATEHGSPVAVHEPAPDRMAVHYSSDRLDWGTPQEFFNRLDAEFGFTLDVCATEQTAKCERYFTPEDDGLSQPWEGVCWMNPPYGNEIGDWMHKAYQEAHKGATVVCLVPSRTDTHWWHEVAMKAREIRFVHGRLRFGGAETSAPFPSAVVVLAPGKSAHPIVSGVRANG